jgi:hypothetical protein
LDTKNSFQSLADEVRLFCGQIDIVLKAELAATRQRISDLSEKLEM